MYDVVSLERIDVDDESTSASFVSVFSTIALLPEEQLLLLSEANDEHRPTCSFCSCKFILQAISESRNKKQ